MARKVRFIGDIHGKYEEYRDILFDCGPEISEMIQVGDFGMGFRTHSVDCLMDEQNRWAGASFIRGNHDDPARCAEMDSWIPDGDTYYDVQGRTILCLGGAWSIDWMHPHRIPGETWWDDEEILMPEMDRILGVIEKSETPDIVVSHDCPLMLYPEVAGYKCDAPPSRTSKFLDAVWEIFKGRDVHPQHWVFGHHHKNVEKMVGKTTFRCLAELAYVDL